MIVQGQSSMIEIRRVVKTYKGLSGEVTALNGISFQVSPGEFLVIKEWDKRDETGNTSVFRYTAGAHGDLIAHLAQSLDSAQSDFRNEQEFVTTYFSRKGKMTYWPKGWCVSFKRHCMHRGIMGFFKPARIPEGAKVVVFHGKPNPPDAIIGRSGKWYRRVLPVAWVDELWR